MLFVKLGRNRASAICNISANTLSNVFNKKQRIISSGVRRQISDEELQMKKKDLKDIQSSILQKNKAIINSIPFDQLTIRMKQERIALTHLNKNEVKDDYDHILRHEGDNEVIKDVQDLQILVSKRTKSFDLEQFQFPWDFEGLQSKEKEKNLLSAIEINQIINEQTAQEWLMRFLGALNQNNMEVLEQILERTFYRKIQELQSSMKEEGFQFEISNLDSQILSVDLFDVKNIFSVGVEQNRRKNKSFNHFIVFDDYINNTIPAKHIVQKRHDSNAKARVYIQLYLNFEVPYGMNISQNKGIEKVTIKSDCVANRKQEKQYHVLVLEKPILECEYLSLRNYVNQKLNQKQQTQQYQIKDFTKLAGYNNLASLNNFKIIDFDYFMNGNPIVSDNQSDID